MHSAVRAALVVPLALAQLVPSAFAQNAPSPAPSITPAQTPPPQEALPLPPDTLEPEPEHPHLAAPPAQPAPPAQTARPATPPPPPEAPPPQDYPLSMQILQAHLSYGWNPLSVTRAGIETPNLLEATAGSPRAQSLVHSGQNQAETGTILSISGIAVTVVTLLIGIPVLSSNQSPYNDNSGAWAGILVGTLVGAVLAGVGSAVQSAGYHTVLEGVNAYNADLLDGRLVPPSATAVPPR